MWAKALLPCTILSLVGVGVAWRLRRRGPPARSAAEGEHCEDAAQECCTAAGATATDGCAAAVCKATPEDRGSRSTAVADEGSPRSTTALLDLPDHLLGLVFAHLRGYRAARRALYSSCRACRESPAINQQLSKRFVEDRPTEEGRTWTLPRLQGWPRHASVLSLALEHNEQTSQTSLPQALSSLPGTLQQKLRGVQNLQVRPDAPEQPGPTEDEHEGGTQWMTQLLAHFPSLTSLVLERPFFSLGHTQGLASARCATQLRKLTLARLCVASPAEAGTALQQLACLSGLQELELVLDIPLDKSKKQQQQAPGKQGGISLGPLGALSQLQRLSLKVENGAVQAVSLRALAAGCSRLSYLQLELQDGVVADASEAVGKLGHLLSSSELSQAAVASAPSPPLPMSRSSCTWPSLQQLLLKWMQPGEAGAVLGAAFRSCPSLNRVSLDLRVWPEPASSAAAVHEMSGALAALPCPVEHLRLSWSVFESTRANTTPLPDLFASLAPLRDRLQRLVLANADVGAEDVGALAAAVGQGLQELDFSSSRGPSGAVALEVVASMPGLTTLWVPKRSRERSWGEDSLLQACVAAQADGRRAVALSMPLKGLGMSEGIKFKQRWGETWAALPQPETGPMRVHV